MSINIFKGIRFISKEEIAKISGFTIGISSCVDSETLSKNPLKSLFVGSVCGCVCSFVAGRIHNKLLPRQLKPIIPIASVLYLTREITKDPIFKRQINNS